MHRREPAMVGIECIIPILNVRSLPGQHPVLRGRAGLQGMVRMSFLAFLMAATACGGDSPRPATSGQVPNGEGRLAVPGGEFQPKVTRLAGDRDRPGLFAQRVTFAPGSCSPVHTHDRELHGLVTRGTLRLGVADSAGAIVVREYPVGSFIPIPAGRAHVEGAGASGESEVYVTGVGPVRTVVRDSTSRKTCEPGTSPGTAAYQRYSERREGGHG